MGIRDNYKAEAEKPAATAAALATSAKTPTAASVGAPAKQAPAERAKILASIEAKMKARQQAGAAVNPPEGSVQLTPDKLEPAPDEAVETEDDAEEPGDTTPAATPGAPVLTRGQKAAATRAANKTSAKAAPTTAPDGPPGPADIQTACAYVASLLPVGSTVTIHGRLSF